ncbi:MAG: molybdenum cofactor guanylyltransferase [Cyanobacteria bacterium P01_F01_bin.53]
MNASMSVSAIILAGGQSRRMGQDKALLTTRKGQSLLSRTVRMARLLTPSVWIVTPWPERYRRQMLSAFEFDPAFELQFVQEQLSTPPHGPLGGFAQGWEQVSSDWCVLLACDLPYLEGVVLQDWWDELRVTKDALSMASLVPSQKGWEPLCGFYHRNCLPGLHRYMLKGGRSFQGWLAGISVIPYHNVPEQMLFNCNTPQDWARVSFSDQIL